MITRETIDEIKNRIDIVDVIGDFISLKRSGQNYKALSPFANEKTPSFFVVPSKGIFKDFSSGKGGDAITFVMEHEKMSYAEALRYLAKKYGVELKELNVRDDNEVNERDSLYIVMNFAKDYFKDLLHSNEEGRSIGLTYFRERGFNDRTIDKFELGYCVNEWDGLLKHALSKGFSEEVLEKAGLIIRRDDHKKYDRFRGRVVFPVQNLAGKVIAFGARILTKEKDQPKYINSPETEIYHKSNVLYGLYQAKNAIRKDEFCYLVEGYTDVISLHQADIENVVASSGTALTEEQIKMMRRFTENVTVLYDGDAAGIRAAVRGIDLVLKGGLNVRIVLLPDGEDPDSFSRKKGSTELKKYLQEHTQDFVSFKISLFSKEGANDPIKKAANFREIIETLSLLPDEIKRRGYYKQLAELTNYDEAAIIHEVNQIRISRNVKRQSDELTTVAIEPTINDLTSLSHNGIATSSDAKIIAQERETVKLLVRYSDAVLADGKLSQILLNELDDVEFRHPAFKKIVEEYRTKLILGEDIDINYLLSLNDSDVKLTVSDLGFDRYQGSPGWGKFHIVVPKESEILEAILHHNIHLLKFRVIEHLIKENLKAFREAELQNRSEDEEKCLTIHEQLKQAEMQIAQILGIVVPS